MRLVLTGEFLADNTKEVADQRIRDFIGSSGVFNTRAGKLIREDRFDVYATVYAVRFDSRAWTGR